MKLLKKHIYQQLKKSSGPPVATLSMKFPLRNIKICNTNLVKDLIEKTQIFTNCGRILFAYFHIAFYCEIFKSHFQDASYIFIFLRTNPVNILKALCPLEKYTGDGIDFLSNPETVYSIFFLFLLQGKFETSISKG